MELPLEDHFLIAECRDCSDGQRESKAPPVAIPKTITNALAPSSTWYPVFWPIIIEQATECQRWRCLRQVNRFFASVDRRIISDEAKRYYFSKNYQELVNRRFPENMGLKLDRHGDYWASWGAGKTSFGDIDSFLGFCELADVDLNTGVFHFDRCPESSKRLAELGCNIDFSKNWVFVSRSRDLLFETSRCNPLIEIGHRDDEEDDCYVRDFGITGAADKVKKLLEYALVKMKWGVEWGERYHI